MEISAMGPRISSNPLKFAFSGYSSLMSTPRSATVRPSPAGTSFPR